MKFLIIDDSITMRRIVMNSLARVGYLNFIEASNGADALAKFDKTIDFIICDRHMPSMSALEFAARLRAREDGRRVPLLMITSRASAEDIALATAAGISGYILKPFQPSTFKDRVEQLTSRSRGTAA